MYIECRRVTIKGHIAGCDENPRTNGEFSTYSEGLVCKRKCLEENKCLIVMLTYKTYFCLLITLTFAPEK